MKVGTKVKMYGCGETSSTFWTGEIGFVKQLGFKKNIFIIAPKDFPKEEHTMHKMQLRKVAVKK